MVIYMKKTAIGFIGFGLIGGSIAKALKKLEKDSYYFIIFDRDEKTLSLAKEEEIADEIVHHIDSSFSSCDFIFLCTPVSYSKQYLPILKPFLSKDCILTDVGSVKGQIHKEITKLSLENFFIGGHPMAGSEQSGYAHSTPSLMENAYFILTPSPSVSEKKVKKYKELIDEIGAIAFVMSEEEHDYIVAAISHLPHIIAASLVNFIKRADNEKQWMKMIASGGLKDITRIASSSPIMWEQICIENSENIHILLESYIHSLHHWKDMLILQKGEQLAYSFQEAGEYRNTLTDISHGPIKKASILYCDIEDESGAIATIASILASSHISLKNIGIIHNREFEQGILRMEFYEETSLMKAICLLEGHSYTIYRR
jgi:prephenate dehydrogenase